MAYPGGYPQVNMAASFIPQPQPTATVELGFSGGATLRIQPLNPLYSMQYSLQPVIYGTQLPPMVQYPMQQPYQNCIPALPETDDSNTDDDSSEDCEKTADNQECGEYIVVSQLPPVCENTFYLDSKTHKVFVHRW